MASGCCFTPDEVGLQSLEYAAGVGVCGLGCLRLGIDRLANERLLRRKKVIINGREGSEVEV